MKWIWVFFSIFIFNVFATNQIQNPNDAVEKINKNFTDALNDAANEGDKECVKLALDEFYIEKNTKWKQLVTPFCRKKI